MRNRKHRRDTNEQSTHPLTHQARLVPSWPSCMASLTLLTSSEVNCVNSWEPVKDPGISKWSPSTKGHHQLMVITPVLGTPVEEGGAS